MRYQRLILITVLLLIISAVVATSMAQEPTFDSQQRLAAQTTSLVASAQCVGPDLEVTITDGDSPFDVLASSAPPGNSPLNDVPTGVYTGPGPGTWTNVQVAEQSGDSEVALLGNFTCTATTDTPIPLTDTPVPPTDTSIPSTDTPAPPTDTLTGSVTPLPDLYVQMVSIELENGSNCNSGLGTSVWVHNQGNADAGPFDVLVNTTTVPVAGVNAGQTVYLWTPDYNYIGPETYVLVDSNNVIAESDESNNTFFELVPIPTLPQHCIEDPLVVSASCVDENLEVSIISGDYPFDITASGGGNVPIVATYLGTWIINGPDKWDNLTVTETAENMESINLGQFKCRSDERPVPVAPAHRSRTTNPFPTFSWTGISNTNNYRVFVFDDANPIDRTVDLRQNSGGPTTLTLITPLPDGRLFWRVRARQNRVWSLWSIRFTLFKDPHFTEGFETYPIGMASGSIDNPDITFENVLWDIRLAYEDCVTNGRVLQHTTFPGDSGVKIPAVITLHTPANGYRIDIAGTPSTQYVTGVFQGNTVFTHVYSPVLCPGGNWGIEAISTATPLFDRLIINAGQYTQIDNIEIYPAP